MPNHLVGESMFWDEGTSVIIQGGLSLRSDGKSRSEIQITDLRTGASEKMTVTSSGWIIVYQLILLIREHFSSYQDLDASPTAPLDPCPKCGGIGMYEDEDGNWPDCDECGRI